MPKLQSEERTIEIKGYIISDVLSVWRQESARFLLRETGGMLIGYWTRSGNPVITHATGPGPNAEHGYRRFVADYAYCQRILDRVIDETGGELTYVGDWHTHPFGRLAFSQTDIHTMCDIAADPSYLCPRPLAAIYRPSCKVGALYLRPECIISYTDLSKEQLIPVEPKIIDSIPGYHLPDIGRSAQT